MEIKELVEKELNKIKQGEFANLDNVKLTSDLGKDIMINIIKNLTIPVVGVELKDNYKPTFEEWWNKQDILETDYNKYVNGYQLKKGETIHQIYERELKINL